MKYTGKTMMIIGALLFLLLLFSIIAAPLVAGQDPYEEDYAIRFQKPSREHLMGTDHFGRDIFSRILYGGRITLPLSLLTMGMTAAIGTGAGIFSALSYGKKIGTLIMRLVDILVAVPFLIVAMAISSILGGGLDKILLTVLLLWWAPFARYTRSLVLSAKNYDRVLAAKVLGAKPSTIVRKEIIPQIALPLVIYGTFEFGSLVLSMATLSFFGMGSKPPTPEWGSMLSEGRNYFMYSGHVLLWPACAVFITVLSLNLFAEGLRDYYDPYRMMLPEE